MRTKLLSTLAVVALASAAPAWAQAPTAKSAGTPGAMAAPPSQAPGQVTSDKLIGRNIQNTESETIGEIKSVVLDRDGKVAAVIVGVGGFLGMGEREVAIQWTALNISRNGEKATVSLTKDQLKALPEYRYAESRQRGTVFTDLRVAPAPTAGTDPVLAPGMVGTGKLVGLDVHNASNESIGEIKDVLLGGDGKAQAVIIAVGGFLGVGERNVAVAWDSLEILRNQDGDVNAKVAYSKEQLKALPAYHSSNGRWMRTSLN